MKGAMVALMRMPGYGARYWAERTADNRRRSYPKFRGSDRADVVVIGGGLTGCAMAYAIAKAGFGVVVLEAERVADGATAGGLGAIVPQPDAAFRAVEGLSGRRVAKSAWDGAARAAKDFAAVLQKTANQEATSPLQVFASTPRTVSTRLRSRRNSRPAGAAVLWRRGSISRPPGLSSGSESFGAISLKDAATYDPVRAALGLAGAAEASGARIFERSAVVRTKFTRKDAEVVLASGRIRARYVVVATGDPGRVFHQLGRHVRRHVGYAVVTHPLSAAMRRVKRASIWAIATDTALDPHWLRWLSDDRRALCRRPLEANCRPKAREGARAADGPAHVRVLSPASGHQRSSGRLELGRARRHDARFPAVDRAASQLSAPLFRHRARLARRRARLVGGKGRDPSLQGRKHARRCSLWIRAISLSR